MNPDELLDYYLGPTGIPDRLRLVNEFLNPIVAIRDAQRQAIRAANPDLDPRERLAAGASSALTTGLMGIPALMANRGYMPSAEALGEILTGIGASSPTVQAGVQEAIARFNQPGPMPTLYSNPIPGLGDNGGPPLDPRPPELGSRTLRAVQELPQERGTYQQLRQALVRSAGGDPAEREIFFTGMDQMFDPQQQVTRQELEDYLARTTPMFRTTEDRASGVVGERANRYDLLEAARQVYPNTDEGRSMYDDLVQQYADRYGLNPHDNATVMEALEEEFEDLVMGDLYRMDDDELASVAGVSPGFDPRATQYSDYFTEGMSDYRERRYGFTNPGAIGSDPAGPLRGYRSAASHFDDEFTPFLHTRTATASAMGGRDNAYHIGEIQSDLGQFLQRGVPTVPETPEMSAYMRLANLRELPPAQWRQIMREGMPGREDWYESTFRLPGWEGPDPGQGEFLVAADNILSRARRNFELSEMYARDEVTALSQPSDLYRDRLRERLPEDWLGFDSPSSAVAALIGELRAGRSPEEIAGNWDLADDAPIMSLIRNASDRGVFNGEAATNLNAARQHLYNLQTQRRQLGDNNAASIRFFIDTDIDPRFEDRLNAGEFFSDQELYQIMRETTPRQASAIFARQELMRRGINPTVVRDLSGMGSVMEAGTRSAQPFIESTNQWVDYALRQELFEAAVEGRPYVTLSNPQMVRRMTGGSEEGQSEFYGSIVPNRLRHLLRRLDRNAQITSSPDEFQSNAEMILGPGFVDLPTGREEVLTVRMTPELRQRILGDEEQGYRGLTTFLRPETAVLGGALASGAFMGQDEGPQ